MLLETLYLLTALYISWIWVDYYRMIDVFDREKWGVMVAAVLIGALSIPMLLGIHWTGLLEHLFPMEKGFVGIALHCIVNVGFFEEAVKTLSFFLIFWVFRSQFREPVDYLIYASLAALGFAAIENYFYFSAGGASIIGLRLVLSSVAHMMFSTFMAYGLILYRFKGKGFWTIPVFFLFAVVSHGIYNLFFIYGKANGAYFAALSLVYFMISVSLLHRMLNNSMNLSPHFDPKKVVNSQRVSMRLTSYFFIALGLQSTFLLVEGENFKVAMRTSVGSLLTVGFAFGIIALRLSRFKLIEGRWEALSFELPFSFQRKYVKNPYAEYGALNPYSTGKGKPRMPTNVNSFNSGFTDRSIKVKGDSYNEALINRFYDEEVRVYPISKRRGPIDHEERGHVREKYYFKGDVLFYLLELYKGKEKEELRSYLIAPKKKGKIKVDGEFPIAGLYECDAIDSLDEMNTEKVHPSAARLIEWVYLKPVEEG